ncbi:MAG: hypothetical protein LC541_20715, partial [Candidatus Thiodiazotropha sp.]|nr:hypothetical protein [Candidatus Thiodiazotropha sp.]
VRGTNRLSKIECLLGLGRLKDITRSKTHLQKIGQVPTTYHGTTMGLIWTTQRVRQSLIHWTI